MMDIQDHITRRSLRAASPLLLWAVHWSVCYLVVAGLCLRGAWSGWAQPLLIALSAVTLAVLGWMLWRLRGRPLQGLPDWAFAGSAVLALAGTAWTSLPLLMLDGCR